MVSADTWPASDCSTFLNEYHGTVMMAVGIDIATSYLDLGDRQVPVCLLCVGVQRSDCDMRRGGGVTRQAQGKGDRHHATPLPDAKGGKQNT